MSPFQREDLIGSLIFFLILAVLAWINLRKLKTGKYDYKALRKRGLMWTEIAVVLFFMQFILGKGDYRFTLVLGMFVLFAASQWLGAIYYERKDKEGQ